jgi:hypothetical protein
MSINNLEPITPQDSYIQYEAWFKIREGIDEVGKSPYVESYPYTLVVNSYGRLRKLWHSGGYTDIHDGGHVAPKVKPNKQGEVK